MQGLRRRRPSNERRAPAPFAPKDLAARPQTSAPFGPGSIGRSWSAAPTSPSTSRPGPRRRSSAFSTCSRRWPATCATVARAVDDLATVQDLSKTCPFVAGAIPAYGARATARLPCATATGKRPRSPPRASPTKLLKMLTPPFGGDAREGDCERSTPQEACAPKFVTVGTLESARTTSIRNQARWATVVRRWFWSHLPR